MKIMNKLNNKQKITVMILITVFVVLSLFMRNISQINKISADITDLVIKNNIVILNVNSTKQKLIDKIGNSNIKVLSNEIEIENNIKISTGDILNYDNQNYSIAILGDTNKDGKVTGTDVSMIYSRYRQKITFDEVQTLAADTNEDNNITGSDVSYAYTIYRNKEVDPDNINTYTITFDSTGGSNVNSITKSYNEEIGTLPTTQKEGYTFGGWYTIDNIKITENTKVLNDVTYYAHWNLIEYSITYNLNDGQVVNPDKYTIETETFTLNNPTKEGYTFLGWSGTDLVGNENKTVTIAQGSANDRTYEAHYLEDTKYTVTFDSTGGSNVNSITKSYDEEIGVLPTTQKEGYTFDGWYTIDNVQITENTKVLNDITYYAHFVPYTYTIKYNSNNAIGTMENQIVNYDDTFTIKENNFTKDNYIFEKWNTSYDGLGTSYYENQQVSNLTNENNKEITLYAMWREKQSVNPVTNLQVDTSGIVSWTPSDNASGYQISIDSVNWTNVPSNQTYYNYFNVITSSVGDKTIYVKAINIDDDYKDSVVVTTILSVHALTINVNNNNYGQINNSSFNVIEGETYTVASNVLTLSDGRTSTATIKDVQGYETTFTSWSSLNGTINSNTLVTANFSRTINTYTITFDSNGGSNVNNITRNYNEEIGILPETSKLYSKLDGWYTSKSGGTKITSSTKITDNVTYYAHWTYIDAIHFLNVGSSDSILIQTQGKFGLIDASNPSNSSLGYNNSTNNGTKVLNYLTTIGVTHLDFIIASHNHSDHIGGIPELVNNSSLVNSSTVYIYKNSFVDQFNGEVTEGVRAEWKNDQFANVALTSMQNKNAKLLETSNHNSNSLTSLNATFVDNTDKNKQYITFSFGNYNFKIYNLYTYKYTSNAGKGYDYTTTDENTNSLVTLITTNNNKKILLMGDMNVENSKEQYYGNLIGKVDIIKASHHGYHYSNSKNLYESTIPSYVFIPNNLEIVSQRPGTSSSTIRDLTSSVSEFGAARLYLNKIGAKVYETGNSNDAYVVLFDNNISINNANGNTLSNNVSEISQNISDGWHIWFDDSNKARWYYIRNNSFLTGWQTINNKQYYFYNGEYGEKSKGQMAYGEFINGYWLDDDGAWTDQQHYSWGQDSNGKFYGYKNSNTDYWWATNNSYYIDGKQYHFDSNGYCTNP